MIGLVKPLVKNAVFRRWADILFLSLVLVVIVFASQDQLSVAAHWFAELSAHWSPLLRYAILCLIAAGVATVVMRLGGLHPNFTHKTMMRYPPFWFAVLIAWSTIITIVVYHHGPDIYSICDVAVHLFPFLSAVCIGVILAFVSDAFECARCFRTPEARKNSRTLHDTRSAFSNDDDLITWILEEKPIRHPEDDIFGHAIPARKIATLLLRETPSSIGIVGPFGSGKSSLINLVEYYLNMREELRRNSGSNLNLYSGNIVCCRIDGWGRTSGSVALKILALAIEKVRCHIDCMSVVSLPENYHKAIAGGKSWGGAVLSALLQTSHDPVVQLLKLDDILAAADFRLIIFLEDLDRNIGDEIIRDEMPALLDRLRVLGQISFVLAIGTEHQYSDILIRICDHVEAIA